MTKVGKITIQSTSDLIPVCKEAIQALGNNKVTWWRGQTCCDWDLQPQLYLHNLQYLESSIFGDFRNKAPVRYQGCPGKEDIPEWLFLMRHYGLPTRLLDWTTSLLTGLFFAVQENGEQEKDGALWALDPEALTQITTAKKGIYPPQSPKVMNFCRDIIGVPGNKSQMGATPTCGIQSDLRHLAQDSMFTIHADSTPINQAEKYDPCLLKFSIPDIAKESLRAELALLGISKEKLFPDLSTLAQDIMRQAIELEKHDYPT